VSLIKPKYDKQLLDMLDSIDETHENAIPGALRQTLDLFLGTGVVMQRFHSSANHYYLTNKGKDYKEQFNKPSLNTVSTTLTVIDSLSGQKRPATQTDIDRMSQVIVYQAKAIEDTYRDMSNLIKTLSTVPYA
jgi:hypothetical protein